MAAALAVPAVAQEGLAVARRFWAELIDVAGKPAVVRREVRVGRRRTERSVTSFGVTRTVLTPLKGPRVTIQEVRVNRAGIAVVALAAIAVAASTPEGQQWRERHPLPHLPGWGEMGPPSLLPGTHFGLLGPLTPNFLP